MSTREPFDFDDEDDRPRRRRRDEYGEDDYDSPRRRRDPEIDDYDDYPRRRQGGDGFGITSMILGIVSCVISLPGFCCILFTGLGVLVAVAAIIFGFVARSQNPESGFARTGIITGFIGVGISILTVVLVVVLQFGMR